MILRSNEKIFLLFIVLLSLLLNIFRLSSIPGGLHGDEAQHGLQAIEILRGQTGLLDFGWYGLPIASFLGQVAGVWAFGQTIFALRISSAIVGALTLIPFYFLIRLLFGRTTGLFSTLFLATSHWWIAFSRLGENYIHVPFIMIVGFLLIVLSFQTRKSWLAFLAGAVIGVNFYLYFAARLTPVLSGFLIAYYLFVSKPTRAAIKVFLLICAGFLILFLPYYTSLTQHFELAFSRQNDVYIYGNGLGSRWRHDEYGNMHLWEVISGQIQRSFYLGSTWHDTSGQYGYQGWMIDPVSGILFVLGFLGLIFTRSLIEKILPLSWFILTVFIGWILTENPPFSPRVVGAIPAMALMTGLGMSTLIFMIRKFAPIARITIICTVTTLVIFINLYAYFVRGVNEEWGDPIKYTAGKVAQEINQLPGYTVVFLTAPFFYADFGPIQYLAPHANIISIDRPTDYKPTRTSRTLYVLEPQYESLLDPIVEANPGGKIEKIQSRNSNIQIIYYRVD